MGLDTGELVFNIEKYFELEIPDPVVEQLYTVGDVAAWLAAQLGTAGQQQSAVQKIIAIQIADCLRQQLKQPMLAELSLSQLFATKEDEAGIAACLGKQSLKWPHDEVEAKSWLSRMFFPSARPAFYRGTVAQLVDWLVARNYMTLLRSPFTSHYDIEQAVIGLTSHSSGVPVPEIKLSSSFTNDLGMD